MPFKRLLTRWLGLKSELKTPSEAEAVFHLKYENTLVGTLSVADGHWRFEYSDEFKQRDRLRPIVEFPNVDATYKSDELWQFFASRIPSPEQAEIGAIIRREHIQKDDAVSLLKRFGKRTIANPFELESV